MSTYCHVCASTNGPFQEDLIPRGVSSYSSLIRCHQCAENFYGVIFKVKDKGEFERWFLTCNKCGALFYSLIYGIPCAQSHFKTDNCPQCSSPFPPMCEVGISTNEDKTEEVLSFRLNDMELSDATSLYKKACSAVSQYQSLRAVVRNIMLVRTKKNCELWAVNIADFKGKDVIKYLLEKAMEKDFVSTGSQYLKFAMKEEDLEILESLEVQECNKPTESKDRELINSDVPKVCDAKKKRKWWQFFK